MEGERTETIEESEDFSEFAEPAEAVEAEFVTDQNPFEAYREARAENKPIVLEFYARW